MRPPWNGFPRSSRRLAPGCSCERPCIGSIALGLIWANAPGHRHHGDRRSQCLVCPDWCEAHGVEKTMGVIAHEVPHVINRHHLRRGERDAKLWNIAADLLINRLLQDDNYVLATKTACSIVTGATQGWRPRRSTRA